MSYDDLWRDFPELQEADVVWEKEVFAHFGLTFFAFSLLEAALQNLYMCWQLGLDLRRGHVSSFGEWQHQAAHYEDEAFKATFGALVRKNRDVVQLDPIRSELELLKRRRDYFAHHFFREENRNMLTDERRQFLILEMARLRRDIESAEKFVDNVGRNILERIYSGKDLDAHIDELAVKLRAEALGDAVFKIGW